MRKEGLLYQSMENKQVKCLTCGHECIIPENKLGFCGTRINEGGKCYSLIYGSVTAEAVDPIEKKPLFHFYPGHSIFSVSSLGCSFKCTNCQNYHISQARASKDGSRFIGINGHQMHVMNLSPEELISRVKKSGSSLLAFTYNEPLIWIEYIIDVGKIAKENGIKIVLVSNGFSTKDAIKHLLPYVDAANIDIKAFDNEFYKKVCAIKDFTPVLDTITRLFNAGKHVEITNLIIPTLNDSDEKIKKLCNWCLDNLGPETPVHFSAYRPMFKMNIPPTPPETLVRAKKIANEIGLKHVYVGNVYVENGENTTCPYCNEVVISRIGYRINKINLDADNNCKFCGRHLNIVGPARKSSGNIISFF
ncbi:MAG: AmmeMemoRadiSam system radical SAM enzyme [Promethearchaeota archaeon]